MKRRTSTASEVAMPSSAEISVAVQDKGVNVVNKSVGARVGKRKKGKGARLWMRFDKNGQSELLECDKSFIITRACIPPRDLRILGPVFSHSSHILAREKAIVVNLEIIRAIITAEEVLLLEPMENVVLPFVDQLRQQLSRQRITNGSPMGGQESNLNSLTSGERVANLDTTEGLHSELPFEFRVLEIALEVVCSYLNAGVADLERVAYPMLDELARNVSNKNLEHVRSLKSNLTRLLARVTKARDEIESLLDNDDEMAQLYLTRKSIQSQQAEASSGASASHSIVPALNSLHRLGSNRTVRIATHSDDNDVEELEMLLEAYFILLDGTRNKILSVREYIDDTEDYVNIQLDNQRNELIQLQVFLGIATVAIMLETLIAGAFGMNIPCQLYDTNGIFNAFVWSTTAACFLFFLTVLGYARWKKLLGS